LTRDSIYYLLHKKVYCSLKKITISDTSIFFLTL